MNEPPRLILTLSEEVAELDEVMPLPRVQDDPDIDAAPIGIVQRVKHDAVCEGVGREVNRAFRARDQRRVDRVEPLFGRKVDLLR